MVITLNCRNRILVLYYVYQLILSSTCMNTSSFVFFFLMFELFHNYFYLIRGEGKKSLNILNLYFQMSLNVDWFKWFMKKNSESCPHIAILKEQVAKFTVNWTKIRISKQVRTFKMGVPSWDKWIDIGNESHFSYCKPAGPFPEILYKAI